MNMSESVNPKFQRRLETYLTRLSRKRSDGIVTANDVTDFMTKNGYRMSNVRQRIRYTNATLRRPNFRPVGYRASTNPNAKYRQIRTWRISGR